MLPATPEHFLEPVLTEAIYSHCDWLDKKRLYAEVDELNAKNGRLAGMIQEFIDEIEAVYPEGPAGEIVFQHDWPDLLNTYRRAKYLMEGVCR
jgi:hypothetical protein